MKEDIPVRVDEDASKEFRTWTLRGDKGVIEFGVRGGDITPYPHDLFIHAKVRQKNTSAVFPDCHVIRGKCYFTNSNELREEAFAVWKRRSSEGVWRYLEKLYDELI